MTESLLFLAIYSIEFFKSYSPSGSQKYESWLLPTRQRTTTHWCDPISVLVGKQGPIYILIISTSKPPDKNVSDLSHFDTIQLQNFLTKIVSSFSRCCNSTSNPVDKNCLMFLSLVSITINPVDKINCLMFLL